MREVRAPVDAQLDVGALVDQQVETLARGQLPALVLLGDLLLAAPQLHPLATLMEILHQRSQQRRFLHRRVRLFGRHLSFGSVVGSEKRYFPHYPLARLGRSVPIP
jgi:hypothetical protein